MVRLPHPASTCLNSLSQWTPKIHWHLVHSHHFKCPLQISTGDFCLYAPKPALRFNLPSLQIIYEHTELHRLQQSLPITACSHSHLVSWVQCTNSAQDFQFLSKHPHKPSPSTPPSCARGTWRARKGRGNKGKAQGKGGAHTNFI